MVYLCFPVLLTKLNHFWLLIESEGCVTVPFTWLSRGHFMVVNWPNFNIVVFQGTGRSKEREKDGGMASW